MAGTSTFAPSPWAPPYPTEGSLDDPYPAAYPTMPSPPPPTTRRRRQGRRTTQCHHHDPKTPSSTTSSFPPLKRKVSPTQMEKMENTPPPPASRQADILPRGGPAQHPPAAFPLRAASGIPTGACRELCSRPRDVVGVWGGVPRGGCRWSAGGGRRGELLWEREEEEGPWSDGVPFQGLAGGEGGEGHWGEVVPFQRLAGGNGGQEPWPDVVPFQGPAEASLAGWIPMHGERLGEIIHPVAPLPQVRVFNLPLENFFAPIFLPPSPKYQHIPSPNEAKEPDNPNTPIAAPSVFPRPRRFYRVQHAAAHDQHGTETFPPSRTRDSAILGITASTIFPPCHERRINRANLERALDPLNVEPTSLVALYSNYGSAMYDFEIHHQMGCADVYIAHVAAESFSCGTVPVMVTPPGMAAMREVQVPVVGLAEPPVLLFSVLSCLRLLGIETEMSVAGVWFAVDSVPARFVVRREARGGGMLDWGGRDGGWAGLSPWEEWGEEGVGRFGVDGVEIVEDRTPPPDEDVQAPSYSQAPSVSVNEEERNKSRSPSSFVDETSDNTRSASMLVEETPGTTRNPDLPRMAQGNAGPSAAGSWGARTARISGSTEENYEEDDDENEEGSTWATELNGLVNEELGITAGDEELSNLINEELDIVVRDVADAPKGPSFEYPSPREGLFIYDSCGGMW
ncbi:hypothetical protein VE03_10141 [Pseudogymnoascus sp. 23342-1-I1]|nr:hypothetical protein VE03_10141 [Pseudogymnoascus sp. 23342-1-I1]